MIISKKSWHYKAMKSWFDYYPENLCEYFWKCIASCLLWVVIGIFGVALSPVWVPLILVMSGIEKLNDADFSRETKAKWWHGMLVTGIALGVLLFFGGGLFVLGLEKSEPFIAGCVLSAIITFVVTGFYFVGLIKFLYEGLSSWACSYCMINKSVENFKPPKQKGPNLFLEWIKAKRQRVCPLIEYVD